eukprot:3030313-Rhodomonas_salina.1
MEDCGALLSSSVQARSSQAMERTSRTTSTSGASIRLSQVLVRSKRYMSAHETWHIGGMSVSVQVANRSPAVAFKPRQCLALAVTTTAVSPSKA